MDLEEVRKKAKKMLANFVDEIGLDGEFYTSTLDCPMEWGKPDCGDPGQFMTPGSIRLENQLKSSEYDERTKKICNQRGLILISEDFNEEEPEPDLFVTVIHETIHSNRCLLTFDATRDGENENAYSFNEGKFVQNTSEYTFGYADASQEILKGSIDTSKKTIDGYKNISSEKLKEMENEIGSQMQKQVAVDEALVDVMSFVAYKLYRDKEKGKTTDVWGALEYAEEGYFKGDYEGTMCKIILKHHDFELFYWMLDPITYSRGDIHYDFWGQYTKNDQDLVDELYKLNNERLNEYFERKPSNDNKQSKKGSKEYIDRAESTSTVEETTITQEHVKEVATTYLDYAPTSILFLASELSKLKKSEDIENEIE